VFWNAPLTETHPMYIKRFYLPCLAHASYLVADEATKTAVVIDPQRDVEQYMECAAENGFAIRQCFLTHFHADFASGHLELQGKTNCTIHLGAKAKPDYEFVAMSDGATSQFGRAQLSVMETPGHTPESISLVLHDLNCNNSNPNLKRSPYLQETPFSSGTLADLI
jgi:hydroxyacylglutathione hydrolase